MEIHLGVGHHGFMYIRFYSMFYIYDNWLLMK